MTVAVVFGGGGARGAFQAGAYQALTAAGLRPRFTLGTSIGAMNAFATTRLDAAAMCQWWLTALPSQVVGVPGRPVVFEPQLDALIALPRRYPWPALAVCGVGRTRAHVVTLQAATAKVWLLASAAIPGVFAPVTIDGVTYIDGGVVNDLPVDIARDLGATTVIAIAAQGLGPVRGAADYLIQPAPRTTGILDFRPRSRAALLVAGQKAAQRVLATTDLAQVFRAT
ncbi:patatin-like phospholipase family protein [Lacticaseibacillus absianus]|uniref:patatin-like phospholipase family protein n=1 Tax=Lacticaseibacillus absianus TaxID=2729623 RepID=UPI0024835F6F|nr:patatin-like phospholipase family protein [Lacticaseibacillus absianus]